MINSFGCVVVILKEAAPFALAVASRFTLQHGPGVIEMVAAALFAELPPQETTHLKYDVTVAVIAAVICVAPTIFV
jgi:hypothetical protein